MRYKLNSNNEMDITRIEKTRNDNFDALSIFSEYLINYPRFINAENLDSVRSTGVSTEYAFSTLVMAVAGEGGAREKELFREYVLPAVKRLDATTYRANRYYKEIKLPEVRFGKWQLKYEKYLPYEGFVADDITVNDELKEIPQIGFFEEEFVFPAVLENGNEWMTVTPNEIATMQPVIDVAYGEVLTFGLGLGYFAYMAAQKKEVSRVTVIERDEEVIKLFTEYVLPQFACKDKVRIIKADAFDYVKSSANGYDCAFVDLWHDPSDGLPLYLKMKGLECRAPNTKFYYWIEKTLLSYLRWQRFDTLCLAKESGEGIELSENDLPFNVYSYLLNKESLLRN